MGKKLEFCIGFRYSIARLTQHDARTYGHDSNTLYNYVILCRLAIEMIKKSESG